MEGFGIVFGACGGDLFSWWRGSAGFDSTAESVTLPSVEVVCCPPLATPSFPSLFVFFFFTSAAEKLAFRPLDALECVAVDDAMEEKEEDTDTDVCATEASEGAGREASTGPEGDCSGVQEDVHVVLLEGGGAAVIARGL